MISQTCRDNLAVLIKAYRRQTGLSVASVSQKSYGNATFVDNFLAGETTATLAKYDTMIEWFRSNWPDGLDWPELKPATFDASSRRAGNGNRADRNRSSRDKGGN